MPPGHRLSLCFGSVNAGFDSIEIDDEFAHFFLHVQEASDANSLDDALRHADEKFTLGDIFHGSLMAGVCHGADGGHEGIIQLGVGIDEDAFPGHQNIVKDHHTVHPTLCIGRSGSTCCEAGLERSICGLIRVCVRQRSCSRTYS